MEAASTPATVPPLPLQALAKHLFGDALAVKVERAAEVLDCGTSTVYNLLATGKLQGVRLSGTKKGGKRVSVLSLLAFINDGGCEPDCKPSPQAMLAAANARRGPSAAVV
jgi:hypothetical protein